MFGTYSNKRLNEAERKILNAHPDDYNWYCVYVNVLFKDERFFQVREDIEIPQNEDDDGVVLMFKGGDIVYFKTIDGDVTDDEVQTVYDVCSHLGDKFHRHITAYVVFPSYGRVTSKKVDGEGEITIVFSSLRNDDGEKTVDRLMKKLKENKQYTISDSIDHMLLPYSGFKDKEVFERKYSEYMQLVNEVGGEKC